MSKRKQKEVDRLVEALGHAVAAQPPLSSHFPTDFVALLRFARKADRLLDALAPLQKESAASIFTRLFNRPKSERVRDLNEWLAKHAPQCGVNNTFVVRATESFGLELTANRQLDADIAFVSVPRLLVLSSELPVSTSTSLLSELLRSMFVDPIISQMPTLRLVLRLLLECETPDSLWSPYLSVLPELPHMPCMEPTSTLQLPILISTPELMQALGCSKWVHELWDRFSEDVNLDATIESSCTPSDIQLREILHMKLQMVKQFVHCHRWLDARHWLASLDESPQTGSSTFQQRLEIRQKSPQLRVLLPWQLFLWAQCVVASRQNSIPSYQHYQSSIMAEIEGKPAPQETEEVMALVPGSA